LGIRIEDPADERSGIKEAPETFKIALSGHIDISGHIDEVVHTVEVNIRNI
jgi:hypothetical protein